MWFFTVSFFRGVLKKPPPTPIKSAFSCDFHEMCSFSVGNPSSSGREEFVGLQGTGGKPASLFPNAQALAVAYWVLLF